MREESLKVKSTNGAAIELPVILVHTLVIGSGAAGLNAAIQLDANGIKDVLIITEGLQMGTSINAGSDKQTYYKLSMCGSESDSPEAMADALYSGGSMDGDLALVEASLSARAFMNLVNIGVSFPRDAFGQFVGFKTDHDPRQRATSVGPYTSREMCRALIRQLERLHVPVHENRIVTTLLTIGEKDQKRVAGAIAFHYGKHMESAAEESPYFEIYLAENIIFAVGGPGGLYKTSVYPEVHTGAIGVALMAGAEARNLQESQYGLSSIKFRWNVSGSYMQVIPRFFSTGEDGSRDENEFLRDYFDSPDQMNNAIFLKGYQWPFNTERIVGGSSIVDILVYIERVMKGRRAFLDFRKNSSGFDICGISLEAQQYLTRSKALHSTPLGRLEGMNPDAIKLFKENGIDISIEPLEIAVCAQHNNGGLAGNLWWESTNIKHLFPVGEVNGSHGVLRPGGSALNAGQVGGFRAAEYIAHRYREWTLNIEKVKIVALDEVAKLLAWISKCENASSNWRAERDEFQSRMTSAGAHIRSLDSLRGSVDEAWRQWRRLQGQGCGFEGAATLHEALNTRQLCYAHAIYLESILFAVQSGLGSRGSAMVLDSDGIPVHPKLGEKWRIAPENRSFREKVLKTFFTREGGVRNQWVDRRPIPKADAWFETAWAAFRNSEIYQVA